MNVNKHYDVMVIGGGTAGVIAAIQNGRAGAKTLLIEKTGMLDGTFHPRRSRWQLLVACLLGARSVTFHPSGVPLPMARAVLARSRKSGCGRDSPPGLKPGFATCLSINGMLVEEDQMTDDGKYYRHEGTLLAASRTLDDAFIAELRRQMELLTPYGSWFFWFTRFLHYYRHRKHSKCFTGDLESTINMVGLFVEDDLKETDDDPECYFAQVCLFEHLEKGAGLGVFVGLKSASDPNSGRILFGEQIVIKRKKGQFTLFRDTSPSDDDERGNQPATAPYSEPAARSPQG